MHNRWKDGFRKLLQETLPLVKLIRSQSTVRDEQRGLVRKMKNTKMCPGDVSFRIDHYLGEKEWRTPLQRLLIDVTMTSSIDDSTSLTAEARIKSNILQLQKAEKGKYERKGMTNKKSNASMTGEDIMRDFNARNYALLPAAISPYGKMGNIIERFMFGTETLPFPSFGPSKPQAKKAFELATSINTPNGILQQATKLWREDHPGETYGSTYHAMDPLTSANQQLGQLVCVANGTHILDAIDKMNGEPVPVDDGLVEELDDWIVHDTENDIATCPETHGYETLMNLGRDQSAQ